MGWVIWHDDDKGRRVYVRRITPNFVAFTLNRADARSWGSRADARAALKGTGLRAHKVTEAAPAEAVDAPVVPLRPDDE